MVNRIRWTGNQASPDTNVAGYGQFFYNQPGTGSTSGMRFADDQNNVWDLACWDWYYSNDTAGTGLHVVDDSASTSEGQTYGGDHFVVQHRSRMQGLIYGCLHVTSLGTLSTTQQMRIRLPLSCDNVGFAWSFMIGDFQNLSIPTESVVTAVWSQGSNRINLYHTASGGSSILTGAELTSSGKIWFAGIGKLIVT